MKAYPIQRCTQCPKVVILYHHRYYCGKREILDPRYIPDWCPLEDYNENINPYRDHFGGFHDTEGYYEDEE